MGGRHARGDRPQSEQQPDRRLSHGLRRLPAAWLVQLPAWKASDAATLSKSRPDVWTKAFALSMKGFYNQRSGIALTAPYTDYIRPRGYHPDDGVKVYQSTCPLMYSGNGLNALGLDRNNFGCLTAGKTDQIVENAWGGYMDAGDWDRRIQHLEASRLHLELMELFPERFRAVSLNIPESGNGLPDSVERGSLQYRFLSPPADAGGRDSRRHRAVGAPLRRTGFLAGHAGVHDVRARSVVQLHLRGRGGARGLGAATAGVV